MDRLDQLLNENPLKCERSTFGDLNYYKYEEINCETLKDTLKFIRNNHLKRIKSNKKEIITRYDGKNVTAYINEETNIMIARYGDKDITAHVNKKNKNMIDLNIRDYYAWYNSEPGDKYNKKEFCIALVKID